MAGPEESLYGPLSMGRCRDNNISGTTNRREFTRKIGVDDSIETGEKLTPCTTNYINNSYEDVRLKRYIGAGVAFVSVVAENLLSHPFLVLRRQCQVHHTSKKYHMQPFTLLPSIYHLHQNQGLTILWKGLGSTLLVRGMSLGVEDLISKVTLWPKDVGLQTSLKQFFKHTLLKCISFAIVTPFYSASFVETVQSEVASEKPGILDVFQEGFMRLMYWGSPSKGRMIPIWALIVPTVTLCLTKYLFSIMVRGATSSILNVRMKNRMGALPKDFCDKSVVHEIELAASIISAISSDIVFYPYETVIHRLYLQGTRTIVDNLDNGQSVLPILTNYTGAVDCYQSCLTNEGVCGLYKGFGALILQYATHLALIKICYLLLSQIGALLQKKENKSQELVDVSPPAITNITSFHGSYLLP